MAQIPYEFMVRWNYKTGALQGAHVKTYDSVERQEGDAQPVAIAGAKGFPIGTILTAIQQGAIAAMDAAQTALAAEKAAHAATQAMLADEKTLLAVAQAALAAEKAAHAATQAMLADEKTLLAVAQAELAATNQLLAAKP